MAVEQPRNDDRTAEAAAELVLLQLRLGHAVPVVEPGVRVQLVAAVVLVAAARERVRARARDELDLDRAVAGRVGALAGARHRDFFDRVEARADDGEEAVAAAHALVRVVLDVHAVERDVDRRARQAVDRRVAVAVRRRDARQQVDEVHRAARRQRELRDLVRVHGRRHARARGIDDFRCRRHGHLLGEAADFHDGLHAGAGAGREDDVTDDDGLETLQRHRHRVGADRQRGDREIAFAVRDAAGRNAGADVLRDNVGARNDRAGQVHDRPGQG